MPMRDRLLTFLRRHGWPLLLVTPVLVLLGLLLYVPLAQGFGLSFFDYSLLIPKAPVWVGLDNYIKALGDPALWAVAGQTILWVVASIGFAAALGILAALLLRGSRFGRPLRGTRILGALILVPFVTPPAVSVFVWKYLYSFQGPINGVLAGLGVEQPVAFLGDTITRPLGIALPMLTLIQTGIWTTFPFFFLMTAAALTTVPDELLEAGALDGATGWRAFRGITWPLIAPVVEIAIFLALLDRLGNVDLPFLLTKGGPLNLTNVWGVFIFQASFAEFDLGRGASLGVLLFLVGLPFAIWYVRRARRQLAGLG
jgi:ABC-type sugar transport system permease subunit